MTDKEDKARADAAGELVVGLLDELNELDLDPDYAAYLLIATGMGLAIANNRPSPIVVNQILSAALMSANKNILEAEAEKEEREEDDDETIH